MALFVDNCFGFSYSLLEDKTPHVRGCTGGDTEIFYNPEAKPRMCGDVPLPPCVAIPFIHKTPHVRGCTPLRWIALLLCAQNPACAGMYRQAPNLGAIGYAKPRMCGDVPGHVRTRQNDACKTPHVRGCTGQGRPLRRSD